MTTMIPYDRGELVSRIHEEGEILSEEYVGDGTILHARVDEALAAALQRYSITPAEPSA